MSILKIGSRAIRDYAAKHGYEIVREYTDEAESGRSASARLSER